LLGTPQYMSPEQARGLRQVDHRSDLWSAAVIAFRMLTGDNPFRGESVGDIVLKICSDELPSIVDYGRDLPSLLDGFFAKAFARKPSARYASADEMAAAFRSFAESALAQPARPRMPSVNTEPLALRPLLASHPPELPPATVSMPTPSDPSAVSAVSVVTGPPIYEATPVSTTVGGTQLASLQPPPAPKLSTQPLTLVVGSAATLIVVGLVAAVWVGSDTGSEMENRRVETFVPGIQPPSSLIDDLGEEAKPRVESVEAELVDPDPDAPAGTGSAAATTKDGARSGAPTTDDRTPGGKSGNSNDTDKPKWF
jgi:serine/threonine-protein kinase